MPTASLKTVKPVRWHARSVSASGSALPVSLATTSSMTTAMTPAPLEPTYWALSAWTARQAAIRALLALIATAASVRTRSYKQPVDRSASAHVRTVSTLN